MVKRVAMTGVKSSCSTPDQDRVRHDLLQPGGRLQNSLKRWTHNHDELSYPIISMMSRGRLAPHLAQHAGPIIAVGGEPGE